MTTPSDPQPGSGEPQYGPPQPAWPPPQGAPQYGPPQYGQPQYGQPQYGQPQYGQPQYGQPQYGQPQYGQPQYGQPHPLTPPPAKKGRGRLVAAAAAAVVVIGGGVATYAAVSSTSSSGGAGDPKSAVKSLVGDLNNSDLIGLLDDLPPGERDAISKPFQKTVDSLKRNDVLRPDANLNKVGGVAVNASGLTFAGETIDINDHVRVVQLTGGKLVVNADLAKAPFTSDFLHAVAPHGLSPDSRRTSTIDIDRIVKDSGKPVRIATQKVGGKWYPSLLYTIADNATTSGGLQAPSAADRIPAVGGSSADDAVKSFITALLDGNVERAGELLSPDELGVIHDYGKLILDRVHYSAPHVRIKDITFTDSADSDGTRVTLKSIEVDTGGDIIKAAIDGDCTSVTVQGQTRRFCSADLLDQLGGFIPSMTPAQKTAFADLLSGATKAVGLDVTQVGGKWYLNPIRSYFNLTNALLSGLKGNDAKELLGLLGR